MPKDRVYQLRLTEGEKKKLAGIASGRELSIAGMIRKDYALGDSPIPTKIERDPSKPLVDNPHLPPAHSASEVKRLAMQRFAHLPLGAAERLVRKELGS